MGYYDKDLKFDLGENLVKGKKEARERLAQSKLQNSQAQQRYAQSRADAKQQQSKADARYKDEKTYRNSQNEKEQVRFDLGRKDKNDASAKEQVRFDLKSNTESKNKMASISGMRKIHPKTTKDMSDDEVYAMMNKIDTVHNDKSSWKYYNSSTMSDGHKVAWFYNGKTDKNGEPITKRIDLGIAKDYSKSKNKEEEEVFDPMGKDYLDPKKVKSKSGLKTLENFNKELDDEFKM